MNAMHSGQRIAETKADRRGNREAIMKATREANADRPSPRARLRRGFALIATALGGVVMIGSVGLAVDVGRMYMTRNEAQSQVDAAVLAATLKLDGTSAGLERAAAEATGYSGASGGVVIQRADVRFAKSAAGPFEAYPSSGTGYTVARVSARTPVEMMFFPVVTGKRNADVSAVATAGQVPKTGFSQGVFPYSPWAHNEVGPNFGLTAGKQYTFRWAANPRMAVACEGDKIQSHIDKIKAANAADRGYIEIDSAAMIRKTIQTDFQNFTREVGDPVEMTNGAKNTEGDAMQLRVAQDTDTTSTTYARYVSNGQGNGRRLVVVPVNGGYPQYIIKTFALFYLLPAKDYEARGNESFCAEFVGAYVRGAETSGAGVAGAYVVRMIE
jgi:Flp pilus assembly protein TadG